MAHKMLAFFLFVFVIVPWGWLRRGKTAQQAGDWHARRTTWDQRGAGVRGHAPSRPAQRGASGWTPSAKATKEGTR